MHGFDQRSLKLQGAVRGAVLVQHASSRGCGQGAAA